MKKAFLIIFAIVVVGGAVYWFANPEVCGDCEISDQPISDSTIVRPGFPNADSIPVNHLIEDNQHTISGILTLPDPCYSIEHSVDVKLPQPELVTITMTTPRTDELCATVVTDKEFEITFQASENAMIQAILNGEEVELFEGEK